MILREKRALFEDYCVSLQVLIIVYDRYIN